ncbi:MAG TPA: hypothetical protein VFV38_03205 [Ktedonobacteraceae bacterium]|nr:hypothetical protein [Ktedonobacteraceae bacterium]
MRQRSEGLKQVTIQAGTDESQEEECEERKIGPAPFLTLNWQDWYEMEIQVHNSINDFLEMVVAGRTNRAITAVLNLQEVARDMLEELYARGIDKELETGPVV